MTCLKLCKVVLIFSRMILNFPTNNNQRRHTSTTIRHKFIGAMVSEMTTHFEAKKGHVLTLGKFYKITLTEKYTLHRQELGHVFE